MGVIIIREMVGTSPRSWSDAARQAVATACKEDEIADRRCPPMCPGKLPRERPLRASCLRPQSTLSRPSMFLKADCQFEGS